MFYFIGLLISYILAPFIIRWSLKHGKIKKEGKQLAISCGLFLPLIWPIVIVLALFSGIIFSLGKLMDFIIDKLMKLKFFDVGEDEPEKV